MQDILPGYILVFLFTLLLKNNIEAQTLFQYNFYTQNQFVLNPASVGQSSSDVFVNYRQQWLGFDGAPRTTMIGAQTNYGKNNGIGLLLMNNRWGLVDDNLVRLSNSYRLRLSKEEQLRFGLSIGLTDRQIDFSKINVQNISEDDFLNSRLSTLSDEWSFNTGFGITYSRSGLLLTVSSPELYNTRDKQFLQSKIALVSYSLPLAQKVRLTPSTLIRATEYNPVQYDFSLKLAWNNMIWVQPTYRSSKNIILSSGINYENLSLGYSFELAGSDNNIANNSHEIVFALSFKKKNKKELIVNNDSLKIKHLEQERALTKEEILSLQEEIEKLKSQMGELTEIVNLKGVDTASIKHTDVYTLKNDKDNNEFKEAISSGYYVVINTCTSLEFAKSLTKMYNNKGIKTSIAFDEKKDYYYVFTDKFDSLEEGVKIMKQKREQGFKNAWVLVYNDDIEFYKKGRNK